MKSTIPFWINIITSISTVVALIYTIRSYNTSKKDLEETKRQWKELHRPHLEFSIYCYDGEILLKLENRGLEVAKNVSLKFDKFLKNDLMAQQLNDHFIELEEKQIIIGANQSKYFNIHPSLDEISLIEYKKTKEVFSYDEIVSWFRNNQDQKFRVACTYTGEDIKTKYTDWSYLSIGEYLGNSIQIIDKPLDAILELSDKLNKTNFLLREIKQLIKR